MRGYFLYVLCVGLLASGCYKNGRFQSPDSLFPKAPLPDSTLANVHYGGNEKQTMDVYLPANRTQQTRLIVIIHGGGWSAGDKSDFNNYVTEFKTRLPGYAIANLNYRLAVNQSNRFPTQENDIKSAITYLKDKAASYTVSSDMILLGISAGAHLALLQAYKHADIVQPRGVVSFYGPTDLAALYVSSLPTVLKSITGFTVDENPTIYKESSPIQYVSASSAPTLLLQGDADMLVPLTQAVALQQKLDGLKVTNKLVVYPGQGHGWEGDTLTDSFNKIQSFIISLEGVK